MGLALAPLENGSSQPGLAPGGHRHHLVGCPGRRLDPAPLGMALRPPPGCHFVALSGAQHAGRSLSPGNPPAPRHQNLEILSLKTWLGILLLGLLLPACSAGSLLSPGSTPVLQASAVPASAVAPASSSASPRAPGAAQATAEPAPPSPAATSASSSAPKTPATFSSSILLKGVTPETYLPDECVYLREQWDPSGSAPGTIVVPVFFHGVSTQGDPSSNTTSLAGLRAAVRTANQLGFEMITSQELAAFLYSNARIPFRSMIWIVDDHNIGTLENQMVPLARENGWVITSAWEIAASTPALWTRIEELSASGLVDVESHGYIHNIPISAESSEAYLEGEIYKPIPILEEHLGHRPVALIWPGSGFTPHAAVVARQAGFELAFTSYARGPLMFDWIPLGALERQVGDPLMVLPREWGSTGLAEQLTKYTQLGGQAATQARASYAEEAAYYGGACGGELPSPATPQPQPTPTH